MTVKPEIEINSLAVTVPTTIMHVHSIIADLPEGHGLTTESIIEMWKEQPRVIANAWRGKWESLQPLR